VDGTICHCSHLTSNRDAPAQNTRHGIVSSLLYVERRQSETERQRKREGERQRATHAGFLFQYVRPSQCVVHAREEHPPVCGGGREGGREGKREGGREGGREGMRGVETSCAFCTKYNQNMMRTLNPTPHSPPTVPASTRPVPLPSAARGPPLGALVLIAGGASSTADPSEPVPSAAVPASLIPVPPRRLARLPAEAEGVGGRTKSAGGSHRTCVYHTQ
jgi:hypothetical protein